MEQITIITKTISSEQGEKKVKFILTHEEDQPELINDINNVEIVNDLINKHKNDFKICINKGRYIDRDKAVLGMDGFDLKVIVFDRLASAKLESLQTME